MRAFIALNLPKKERQRIHRAARRLREEGLPVRWANLEAYHVTLKFLGDLRPDRAEAVEDVLKQVATATAPFPVTLSGFGAFPTIRRPRVLWLGVQASPELRCLKQDIEWGLSDRGFAAETRAFHPHVTLGRANNSGGAGDFRGLDGVAAAMDFSAEVTVRSVELMRSHLSREGARYSVLSAARLTGP